MSAARSGPVFWRSFAIFEGLAAEPIAMLDAMAIPRRWMAGETLFQRGDEGEYVILVHQGRIKLSLLTANGRELTLRYAEPGDILGELSLLDGQARSADATAAEAGEGLVLRRADFERLRARFPDIAGAMIRYLAGRLRDTTEQLESIAMFEIEARLARFLLLTLRQYFEDDIPETPQLRLALNQSELAAMLGASRPKVNKAIQALEAAKAISRNGDVLSCDLERLMLIADPALQ